MVEEVMYPRYIMGMQRTQISLSDDDRRVLDAVARRTGRSMSAVIRDAIHLAYGPDDASSRAVAALEATFGVIDIAEDGATLVDSIRSGRRLDASA